MNENPILDEFTEEERAELGNLDDLVDFLMSDETPEQDTAAFLTTLEPMMPQKQSVRRWQDWLTLARSQLHLLDANFWWTTLLLFVAGLVLDVSGGEGVPSLIALLMPVFAVMGVAYVFRPAARSLLELERFSSITSFELLMARMVLLLVYNSLIALVLIAISWNASSQITLSRLLLIWFGPMLGLSGLALYLTLRWNRILGIIVPMTIWCMLIFAGWRETLMLSQSQRILDHVMVVAAQSDVVLMGSWMALVVGCALYALSLTTQSLRDYA